MSSYDDALSVLTKSIESGLIDKAKLSPNATLTVPQAVAWLMSQSPATVKSPNRRGADKRLLGILERHTSLKLSLGDLGAALTIMGIKHKQDEDSIEPCLSGAWLTKLEEMPVAPPPPKATAKESPKAKRPEPSPSPKEKAKSAAKAAVTAKPAAKAEAKPEPAQPVLLQSRTRAQRIAARNAKKAKEALAVKKAVEKAGKL